jgi:molybdate transport system substrate-binding protein
MQRVLTLAVLAALLFAGRGHTETVRVAVASNFATVAAGLGEEFQASTGFGFELVAGSTGKLYAQIIHGAPYDMFLAADAARPERLEAAGLIVAGSRRTYAIGRLVAWSRAAAADGSSCIAALAPGTPGKVAIANPRLAPYGAAAREFLVATGRWDAVEPRLVLGENIAQTLQFAADGGAVVALVAAAQLDAPGLPEGVCAEPVPGDTHQPIEQQLVWLRRAGDNPAAAAFNTYLGERAARDRIQAAGYDVPRP